MTYSGDQAAERLAHALIGGLGVPQFDADVRERSWRKFEAAFDAEQIDALFNLARLERVLGEGGLPALVDIYADGHLKRLVDMQNKSGLSALDVAARSFREGQTVRVRDVDRFDRTLNDVVAAVRRIFAAAAQANIYLTPPDTGGFPPHFDITDVFVVQLSGMKRWKIFADYSNRVELPLPSTDWDPERFVPADEYTSVELQPGDVLYLPRGTMHSAACVERESMHLTISLMPSTFFDLLSQVTARAAETDVELRRRVPCDGTNEDLADEIRSRLITILQQADLTSLPLPPGTEEPEAASDTFASAIADMLEQRD